MRFDVTDQERSVTLIARRNEECSAQVIDFSRSGIRVTFAEGPDLEIDQDVLIANEQEVSVCTVRNIAECDDGGVTIGLLVHHTFPIARLPEKKRAHWGYKDDVSTFPIGTALVITLALSVGLGAPMVVFNLGGIRNGLYEWAAQPMWMSSPRATVSSGKAAEERVSSSAALDGKRQPEPSQQARSTVRRSRTSLQRTGSSTRTSTRSTSTGRRKTTFTADDAMSGFSGSL